MAMRWAWHRRCQAWREWRCCARNRSVRRAGWGQPRRISTAIGAATIGTEEQYARALAIAQASLSRASFAAAWAAGQALSIEQAIAEAIAGVSMGELRSVGSERPAATNHFGLSPREMDVLRLLVARSFRSRNRHGTFHRATHGAEPRRQHPEKASGYQPHRGRRRRRARRSQLSRRRGAAAPFPERLAASARFSV